MIFYETEEQELCDHMSWEKVVTIDETYWRCFDCQVTADKPAPNTNPITKERES